MVITPLAKIKNGKIALPDSIQKSWGNSIIYLNVSDDTIVLKRFNVPKTSETVFDANTLKKLKSLGTRVFARDVRAAIRVARKDK